MGTDDIDEDEQSVKNKAELHEARDREVKDNESGPREASVTGDQVTLKEPIVPKPDPVRRARRRQSSEPRRTGGSPTALPYASGFKLL